MTVLCDLMIYFAIFGCLFGGAFLALLLIAAVLWLHPKTRNWMEEPANET